MKVVVNKDDGFKPVTLNITCETPEELFALWARFSLSYNKVISISNSKSCTTRRGRILTGITDSGNADTYPAFKVIDEVVDEYLENLEGN